MIKQFLQFIKKQKLAIRLARFDSLFIIAPLQAFRMVMPLARLFRHKSGLDPLLRFQQFLEAEHNPLLTAAYEEFSCRTDIFPEASYILPTETFALSGDIIAKTTEGLKDVDFYLSLFSQIISQNFPRLADQFQQFEKRLDAIADMRFYAAELEILCNEAAAFEYGCPFEIDWIRTSKEKLALYFDQSYEFSAKLPLQAQENLSKFMAYLIFEKSIFFSSWDGIGFNAAGEVCIVNFDYLYPVSPALRQYAVDCLTHCKEPMTVSEYKMRRALFLLEEYCPDIKVFKSWKPHFVQEINRYTTDEMADQSFLAALQANGLGLCPRQPIIMTNPQDVAFLLDSRRHKNDPQYKKSSLYYWGPLALVVGWLLFFF